MSIARPGADEFAPYYGTYVNAVEGKDALAALESQRTSSERFLTTPHSVRRSDMNAKSYFAGILTGGLFVLAGYLMGHSSPVAMAAAPGDAAGGYIIATPPTGANEKLIYVWDSSEPTKPL